MLQDIGVQMVEEIVYTAGVGGINHEWAMRHVLEIAGFYDVTKEYNLRWNTNYSWVLEYADEDRFGEFKFQVTWRLYRYSSSSSYSGWSFLVMVENRVGTYANSRRDYYLNLNYNGNAASIRVIKGDNFIAIMNPQSEGQVDHRSRQSIVIIRTNSGKIVVYQGGGYSGTYGVYTSKTTGFIFDPVTKSSWTSGNAYVEILVAWPGGITDRKQSGQYCSLVPVYYRGNRVGNAPAADKADNLVIYAPTTGLLDVGTKFKVGDDYYVALYDSCAAYIGSSLNEVKYETSDYDIAGAMNGIGEMIVPGDSPYFWFSYSRNNISLATKNIDTGQIVNSGAWTINTDSNSGWYGIAIDQFEERDFGIRRYIYLQNNYNAHNAYMAVCFDVIFEYSIERLTNGDYKVVSHGLYALMRSYPGTTPRDFSGYAGGSTQNENERFIIGDKFYPSNFWWRIAYLNAGTESRRPGNTSGYITGGTTITPSTDNAQNSTAIKLYARIPSTGGSKANIEQTLGRSELQTIVRSSDKMYYMSEVKNGVECIASFKITASNVDTLAGLKIQFQSGSRVVNGNSENVTDQTIWSVEYIRN